MKSEISNAPEGLKFEYYLKIWGGFFNDNWKAIHKREEGEFWFDTRDERDQFVRELRVIELTLGKEYRGALAMTTSEGLFSRVPVKCHRVCEYMGKQYYSEYTLSPNTLFSEASYWIEHKWYPGFNDYPLGEEFKHYGNVTILVEWVTGAFDIDTDY